MMYFQSLNIVLSGVVLLAVLLAGVVLLGIRYAATRIWSRIRALEGIVTAVKAEIATEAQLRRRNGVEFRDAIRSDRRKFAALRPRIAVLSQRLQFQQAAISESLEPLRGLPESIEDIEVRLHNCEANLTAASNQLPKLRSPIVNKGEE